LIPSIVRSRIQDGKKNFSDSQGEVTVIFIDIDGFDQLVQQYTGRELIELLDRVYNTFDSLCEQHGLQKIETVGKTYMACGGLKVVEKDIDNRLLGSHHSVRVTDFACSA
jgi:class 3 adenylate cyclase